MTNRYSQLYIQNQSNKYMLTCCLKAKNGLYRLAQINSAIANKKKSCSFTQYLNQSLPIAFIILFSKIKKAQIKIFICFSVFHEELFIISIVRFPHPTSDFAITVTHLCQHLQSQESQEIFFLNCMMAMSI